ncbi:MAG: nucleoside deaminase [Bacteroidales bacterium]|nr:nucleoside deaminase [Bacteroidales bacterium]
MQYNPTPEDIRFMRRAVELSIENVKNGGGPFGAVIVRDGEIIAEGVNRVTANNDPTAHAEVTAIRAACAKLGTFQLDGCVVYTSCEPCPMCLSAIYWAGISKIYYGNTKKDADDINFGDDFIYEEIAKPYAARRIPMMQLLREEALAAFRAWEEKPDKIEY